MCLSRRKKIKNNINNKIVVKLYRLKNKIMNTLKKVKVENPTEKERFKSKVKIILIV